MTIAQQDQELLPGQTKNLLKKLFFYLKPYQLRVLIVTLLLLFSTAVSLAGPQIIGYAISSGVEKRAFKPLAVAFFVYLTLIVINYFISNLQFYLMANTGERVLKDLRQSLFSHLLALSMSFYENQQVGKTVARMTTDFDAMEDIVQQGLSVFITNTLLFIAAMIVLPIYCWQLFLVVILTVVPMFWLTRWFEDSSKKAYLAVRDKISQTLTVFQEGISGIKVIQAFTKEDAQIKKFRKHNEAQFKANLAAVSISLRYFPVLELTGVVSTGVIIGLGGVLAIHHVIGISKIVAFVLYLGLLYSPIQQLGQLFGQFQSALAAFGKISDVLSTEPDVKDLGKIELIQTTGAIELSNVTFCYKGSEVKALQDINLVISPGQHVALVGPTGAGKSTLAKLIARFYDPTKGAIYFSGINLKDIKLSELRKKIVMVAQEGFVFNSTIEKNIALATPWATTDDIRSALSEIGVLEHFESFEQGLQTPLNSSGGLLSAGELQLISLARVALLKPSVLILDEATSSLDPYTEKIVNDALQKVTQDMTLIVIAHRLSTVKSMDKIVVVQSGKIKEQGTHLQLLQLNGTYKKLFQYWLQST
jgi:ATP-binding cassette subfamily B protein